MIVVLLSLLLVGCAFPFNSQDYMDNSMDLNEAWLKTASFKYIAEEEGVNYWKSPKEFEADGGGDCEDFVVYMVYLLGPEASMVAIEYQGSVHALVYFRGNYLEPQAYPATCKGVKVVAEYSYDYLMLLSTIGGTKCVSTGKD